MGFNFGENFSHVAVSDFSCALRSNKKKRITEWFSASTRVYKSSNKKRLKFVVGMGRDESLSSLLFTVVADRSLRVSP